jgi:penicillin amidase
MINEKEKLSIKDFERMQNDQHSKFAELFLNKLLPYLDNKYNWSESENAAIQTLKKWEFDMSPDEIAPSLLDRWSYNLIVRTFKDEMGADLFNSFLEVSNLPRQALYNLLNDRCKVWIDNVATEKKESFQDIVVSSFRETVHEFENDYGKDTMNWQWGKMHQLTLVHPLSKVKILDEIFKLNRGPFKVGGSYHTIAPYTYPFFEPGKVIHGASHRSIYDLKNWNGSVSVIPTGTSGISSSEFYCDQTSLYINGGYHEDYFSFENVKQNARYKAIFTP